MTNVKRRRLIRLVLILAISSLFPSPLHSQDQRTASSPNVKDTAWRAPDINWATSLGPAVSKIFYAFDRDGKVTCRALSMQLSEVQAIGEFQDPMFNPFGDRNPYRMKVYTAPAGAVAIVDEVGTYKTNGNKLFIDFASWTVTATVTGNEMTGVSTKKDSNKKEEWKVTKIQPKNAPPK